MSASSTLIKTLCILFLFFVAANANIIDDFWFSKGKEFKELEKKQKKQKAKLEKDINDFGEKLKKKDKDSDDNDDDDQKPKKKNHMKFATEGYALLPNINLWRGKGWFPLFSIPKIIFPGQEQNSKPEPEQVEVKPQATNQTPQPIKQNPQPIQQKPPVVLPQVPLQGEIAATDFPGEWAVALENSGVSAMHLQLMPNGKFVMFDATSLGKSSIALAKGNCRNFGGRQDCFAHSVEYDPKTNKVRPLKVITDPWCSSGGLTPDGILVGTGGWADGERTLRYFTPCENCDWRESAIKLADPRWYATQTLLPDGRFVVIGGRRAFSYEFLAPEGLPSPGKIELPFLRETTDIHENNLYPFVHVAPDGNLFILANFRSILLNVLQNKIVRRYPDLPGGARNYPGSGSSAIIPIDLRKEKINVDIEVLVCGGAQPLAFGKAEKEGIFLPAVNTCGRIKVLAPNSQWEMENMPSARVMGDMLNLPNGEILMLNGARKGSSGWQFADDPNLTPFLYTPNKPNGQRFKQLTASKIPRMYHSSSAVLPDGRVLVAGSNTNPRYTFENTKFPTELRIEKFSPPYLDPRLQIFRPEINAVTKLILYGGPITVQFQIQSPEAVQQQNIVVALYQPPFTTHGYSMNQRLLYLPITMFSQQLGKYNLIVTAPASRQLAPPGNYLLFVNYKGVPSPASWVKLI